MYRSVQNPNAYRDTTSGRDGAAAGPWQSPRLQPHVAVLLLCGQGRCPSKPRDEDHSSLASVCSSKGLPERVM